MLATSCATIQNPTNSASQPAPEEMIFAIQPGSCPGLDDHFAISTDGLRALLLRDRQLKTQHAIELAECFGARQIAEATRDQAVRELKRVDWWSRWGFIIGLGSGLIAGAGFAASIAALIKH